MQKIRSNSLTLQYNAKEDRMKLIINKDTKERLDFWITRRFYLSILFELDTYNEQLGISDLLSSSLSIEEEEKLFTKNAPLQVISDKNTYLLDNVKISLGEKRQRVFLSFHSGRDAWKTVMHVKRFLVFYRMMKSSFPKKEWGFI